MCVFVFQIRFSTNIMPSRDSHYILRLLFVSKNENCVNVFCVTSFNQYLSKTGNPVYMLHIYYVSNLVQVINTISSETKKVYSDERAFSAHDVYLNVPN